MKRDAEISWAHGYWDFGGLSDSLELEPTASPSRQIFRRAAVLEFLSPRRWMILKLPRAASPRRSF
jgi:hypothetical protein